MRFIDLTVLTQYYSLKLWLKSIFNFIHCEKYFIIQYISFKNTRPGTRKWLKYVIRSLNFVLKPKRFADLCSIIDPYFKTKEETT